MHRRAFPAGMTARTPALPALLRPEAAARGQRNTNMKKLPNAVKWLIIVVVLALMGWMLVKVNDRASRVKMPEPDNSLGIYRKADA